MRLDNSKSVRCVIEAARETFAIGLPIQIGEVAKLKDCRGNLRLG